MQLLLLALVACGSAPSEVPADAGPAASITVHKPEEGKSSSFTLLVSNSPEAEAMLKKVGESVHVSMVVHDGIGGDDGTYREKEFDLPAEGGILEVPGLDLSPVKPGKGPLSEYALTVTSTRKKQENNLLNCSFLGGGVAEIGPRMNVECTPL